MLGMTNSTQTKTYGEVPYIAQRMEIVSQRDGYGHVSYWAINERGEKYHAVGPDDSGIRWSTYPTGYDSRCASCWLNHCHTEDKHRQSIARHEASA